MHNSFVVRTTCDVALLPPGTPWAVVQYMLPVMCVPHHVYSCYPNVYYMFQMLFATVAPDSIRGFKCSVLIRRFVWTAADPVFKASCLLKRAIMSHTYPTCLLCHPDIIVHNPAI